MSIQSVDEMAVRPYRTGDRSAVLALLAASLGFENDARLDALYAWKHELNVFGASPAWVAEDGDRIVGFRTFMRWQFEHRGRTVEAVRAVDTATHRDYQGRGLFTKLTRHAVEQLDADGVGFIFNTPNDKSRPGYLKMGWRIVGRLPLWVRPLSLAGTVRALQARVPAEVWSHDSTAGDPASDLLQESGGIRRLLASQPRRTDGLRTLRSAEYLSWRYADTPFGYRALALDGAIERGVGVFRVRRRGVAREVVLDDVFVEEGDRRAVRRLMRAIGVAVDADYMIRIARGASPREAFVPVPRQGPVLTWRALREKEPPPRSQWDVSLGDIEVF